MAATEITSVSIDAPNPTQLNVSTAVDVLELGDAKFRFTITINGDLVIPTDVTQQALPSALFVVHIADAVVFGDTVLLRHTQEGGAPTNRIHAVGDTSNQLIAVAGFPVANNLTVRQNAVFFGMNF